jgi:hypothetical protein
MKGYAMKRLTYFVVILALIYGSYWVAGSYAVENGARTQLEKLRDDGWDVDYSALKTRGFPSRFDTTATDISIETPDRAFKYEAAIVQTLALSYQPNRMIVAFPPTQTLSLNGLPITVKSEQLRASAGVATNTALSLDTITAEATLLTISFAPDRQIALSNVLIAMREAGTLPNTYDAYASVTDIALPSALMSQIDPTSGLPTTIEAAIFDASVSLDRPVDRHTVRDWSRDPAQLRNVTLRSLALTWGAFLITGDGAFTVDAAGTPDGTITITFNNWKGMLAVAQSAGMIPDQYKFMAQSIGQTLSQGEVALVLPITVQNGNLSIGPLPLGPSPKFH